MTTSRATVSVVVPCWNCAGYVERCLDAVAAQTHPVAEVVAIDNASGDGTADLLARCGGVEVVRNAANLGFGPAANQGIERTRGELVLLLNPDVVLAPDYVERALPALADPRVGIVAGKLLRPDGRTLDSAGQLLGRSRRVVDRGYGRPDRGQLDADAWVLAACGAAALYRRAMLDDVRVEGQVFDEAFFAFHEDLDLGWRAHLLGWRARYVHDAVAVHVRSATAGTARRWLPATLRRPPELQFHILKNRYLTIVRNDTLAGFLLHLPWIAARDAALALAVLLPRPALAWRLARAMPALVRRARRQRRELQARRRERQGRLPAALAGG